MSTMKEILKSFKKELKTTYQAQKNIVDVTDKYIGLMENAEDGGGAGGVNYSTTEQKTGLKWIDDKDIYQITIINSNIATLEPGSYSTTLSGVNTVIDINGYIKEGNIYFALPYVGASGKGMGVSFNVSDNKIYVSGNDTFSNADLVVTLKYTKA